MMKNQNNRPRRREKFTPETYSATYSNFDAAIADLVKILPEACDVIGVADEYTPDYVIGKVVEAIKDGTIPVPTFKADSKENNHFFSAITLTSTRGFVKTDNFVGFGWDITYKSGEIISTRVTVTLYRDLARLRDIMLDDYKWNLQERNTRK